MHVWPAGEAGWGVRGRACGREEKKEGCGWGALGGLKPTHPFHLREANTREVCVFALDGEGKV